MKVLRSLEGRQPLIQQHAVVPEDLNPQTHKLVSSVWCSETLEQKSVRLFALFY